MKRFPNWISRSRERFRWSGTFYEHQFCVALHENGFEIYYRDGEPPVARVDGNEVRAIRTYKLDVYS